ncbi:MAG: purine-nucleoside phosphorylase [Coriobacteriia bacterium]|nr:purine-nucleoside phosphorylase [Coriobacteriia bacterium]
MTCDEVSLGVPASDVDKARGALGAPAKVAIVLGSGLSGLADEAADAVVVPYGALDGFPRVGAVAGHAGRLVAGTVAGARVLLFQGRAHLYQGVTALDAAYPARLAAAAGCDTLVVTNAAGGVREDLRPGDLVLISDHLNLMGTNPLVGWPGPEGGFPFVPMRDAYDPGLREVMRETAGSIGIVLSDGVYAGLLGPSYETPAEVRMLRELGADVVGMSTVPEVIAARALGMRVVGLSLVTNAAAGIGLSHQEVLEAGVQAAERMKRLMTAFVACLAAMS